MALIEEIPTIVLVVAILQVLLFAVVMAVGFIRESMQKLGVSLSNQARIVLKILAGGLIGLAVIYKIHHASHTIRGDLVPAKIDPSELWLAFAVGGGMFVFWVLIYTWVAKRRGWR